MPGSSTKKLKKKKKPSTPVGPVSVSSAEAEGLSRSSSHSSYSPLSPERRQDIFVSFGLYPETRGVSFFINANQRPGTLLDGQGDHITSYIVIIQTMLSLTETRIRDAIDKIKRFGHSVLAAERYDALEALEPPQTHEHEQRITAIDVLQQAKLAVLNDTVVSQLSQALRTGKLALLSQHLCDLTTLLLSNLQLEENTTVFSTGRMNKLENESSNTKKGARGLFSVNTLCRWSEYQAKDITLSMMENLLHGLKSRNAKIPHDTEEDHILRYGLNVFDESKSGKLADDLLKSLADDKDKDDKVAFLQHITACRDKLLKETDTLTELMGFLYDFKRVLEFDASKAFPIKDEPSKSGKKKSPDKIKYTKEHRAYWEASFKEYFDEKSHGLNLIDYKRGVVIVERQDLGLLKETVVRHFKFLLAAFPNLFRQVNLSNQVGNFISAVVLDKRDWSSYLASSGGEKLDKKSLLHEVEVKIEAHKIAMQEIVAVSPPPSLSVVVT